MIRWVVVLVVAACAGAAPATTTPSNRAVVQPTSTVPYVGNLNASVRVDYYFDYECPHCLHFAPMLDDIAKKFGDRIVVFYRNFQMTKHPLAREAAVAAEAARRQGKFFEMYKALIALGPRLEAAALRTTAEKIVLDLERFDTDVKDPAAKAGVAKEYTDGEAAGVYFVPALIINGTIYEGDMDIPSISAAIEQRF